MSQSGLAASADATGSPPLLPDATPDQGVGRGFQRLSLAATVVALVLIAIGGAVRSTDSGLACPDWPRCFGLWIPPADLNMWIEHTHRLVAGVLLIMIWVLALWVLRRFRDRRELWLPVLVAWVGVHAQALLGALVVWNLLKAELVTAHLGMAMVVVAALLLTTLAAAGRVAGRWNRTAKQSAAVALLAYLQILVGGHVTGIGASLVYTDFPTMGGTMFPDVSTAPEAFHVLHRVLGFALLIAVCGLAVAVVGKRARLRGLALWHETHKWTVKLPMWAATLIVVQIVLGVANLWSKASYLTVTPHLAVASWIWAVLVVQTVLARRLPQPDVAVAAGERV